MARDRGARDRTTPETTTPGRTTPDRTRAAAGRDPRRGGPGHESAESTLTKVLRTGTGDGPIDRVSAAARVSAYVYGNILVLASLVALSNHTIHTGAGALIVLGTAFSTFIAHQLAHEVGTSIEHPGEDTTEHRRASLLDSRPILTSGSVPALILAVGYWDWIPAETAQILASVLVIVRIALIGAVVVRLTDEDRPLRALFGGIGLAAVAALVVLLKITVAH
ncbi:hypothetical protein D1871_00770 [Nakamurella silvestris]|nr:hypothetical protein D1871_00770 [Nakamurella silvestris]